MCLCDFVNDECYSVIVPVSVSPGKDRGPWYHLHSGCPPLTCCTGSHAVPGTASSLYPPATDTVQYSLMPCCTGSRAVPGTVSSLCPSTTAQYSVLICCTVLFQILPILYTPPVTDTVRSAAKLYCFSCYFRQLQQKQCRLLPRCIGTAPQLSKPPLKLGTDILKRKT